MGLDFRQPAALFPRRQVWQRVPKRARRSAIDATADLLAPRSEVDPQAGGGAVAVAGAFRASSGLGHSARLCEMALRAAGHWTAAIDLTHVMMANSGDRPEELAELVPEGPGSIIVHVNSPLLPLALLSGATVGARASTGQDVLARDLQDQAGGRLCEGRYHPRRMNSPTRSQFHGCDLPNSSRYRPHHPPGPAMPRHPASPRMSGFPQIAGEMTEDSQWRPSCLPPLSPSRSPA